MALIVKGSIDDFAVFPDHPDAILPFSNISNFRELREVSKNKPGMDDSKLFSILRTDDERGLSLKKIILTKTFESFLPGAIDPLKLLHFLAWTWDMSGNPIEYYPVESEDQDMLLVKKEEIREFSGEIKIFSQRQVVGGIAVRIYLWESGENADILNHAAAAVRDTRLNVLLKEVSATQGVTAKMIDDIKTESLDLSRKMASILENNTDDHVDLFEGYFTADKIWLKGKDRYRGNGCSLTLNKN